MNASRFFATTAVALSALAAIGCTSTTKTQEVAAAPQVFVVPQETVVIAEPMPTPSPSYTVAQAEPSPQVTVRSEPPITMASADIIERAPQADRN